VHGYPSKPLRRAFEYWASDGGPIKDKIKALEKDNGNDTRELGFLALGVWMELISLDELKEVLPTRQSQRLACRVCLPTSTLLTSNPFDDLFNSDEEIDSLEDNTRIYLRIQRGQSPLQRVDNDHDEEIIKDLGSYSREIRRKLEAYLQGWLAAYDKHESRHPRKSSVTFDSQQRSGRGLATL